MYKLLLCWRYLLTRYLALVCIVSVLLGVATLIVVNSVMAGFSSKLRDRLHGALSDIVMQSWDYQGFDDPTGKMEQIRADPELNSRIDAMTPTVEIFAMFQFRVNGTPIVRAVRLIGIDPKGRAQSRRLCRIPWAGQSGTSVVPTQSGSAQPLSGTPSHTRPAATDPGVGWTAAARAAAQPSR